MSRPPLTLVHASAQRVSPAPPAPLTGLADNLPENAEIDWVGPFATLFGDELRRRVRRAMSDVAALPQQP
jgi:hypothetical protein